MTPVGKLILLFAFFRILSVLFSEYFLDSSIALYKELIFYFSFFTFSYFLRLYDEMKIKKIVVGFFISSVFIAILGLILFNFKYSHRASVLTTGYSTVSQHLMVSIIFFYYFFLNSENKGKQYWFWLLGISIMLGCQVLTLTRMDILITVAAMVFLSIKSLKRIKTCLIIFCISFILVAFSLNNNKSEFQNRVANPTALSDRDILLKGSLSLIYDHPLLGYGPYTFPKIFPLKEQLNDKGVSSFHNLYFEIYLESGLLLLGLFFVMIFYIFYKSWIILKAKNLSQSYSVILKSTIISIGCLLMASVTSGFIFSPIMSVTFSFLLALLTVFFEDKNEKKS